MKIPAVKGTRDFYPRQMAVRNFIIDGWKQASIRNGFEEYDGPIFEYLTMYQVKSGQEIAEQLFSLTDRGGRQLAIRPEITPTLARMVNQQINSLPKPIKWFSVPRLCRAERPQKGRLREFFQWNIDIIGEESIIADAEVIFTTLDYLRKLGLTQEDIQVKISSRKLLASVLTHIGIPAEKLAPLYVLLDKKAKLPSDTFRQLLAEQVTDKQTAEKILTFMEIKNTTEIKTKLGLDDGNDAYKDIEILFNCLNNQMAIGSFCVFDPSIVRGLAYYTGIVFEVHDIKGDLRAICGGGRYDNLLADFGGPAIPATGMGMGDCVLEILLEQKGLLDKKVFTKKTDYFVAVDLPQESSGSNAQAGDIAVKLAVELRNKNYSAEFSYKPANLRKQLKYASENNAQNCIILGQKFKDENKLIVKDMTTGDQYEIDCDKFLKQI